MKPKRAIVEPVRYTIEIEVLPHGEIDVEVWRKTRHTPGHPVTLADVADVLTQVREKLDKENT